jgi:uncharacterized protein YqeY
MIREELKKQLVEAMKAKDDKKTATIRLINAAIKQKDIEARPSGKTDGIDDAAVLSLMQSMIKQRRESIDMYTKGGRADLAAAEQAEIDIIQAFLPKQMGEDVSCVIYNSSDERISLKKTVSMRSYAMDNLKKTDDNEFKTALVDMLNYGAAAQIKYNYDVGNLVNSGLTDDERAFGTSQLKPIENNRETDSYYYATNTRFVNSVNILFAFKNIDKDNSYAIFTWVDHQGIQHSQRVDEFATSSDMRIVELEALAIVDARQSVTCTIYDKNTNNVISIAIDSMESNAARASAANQEIYQSFMKFADSAYVYLH